MHYWVLISLAKVLHLLTTNVAASRRPGQSRITTPRKESDKCKIYSGVAEGEMTLHISLQNILFSKCFSFSSNQRIGGRDLVMD